MNYHYEIVVGYKIFMKPSTYTINTGNEEKFPTNYSPNCPN